MEKNLNRRKTNEEFIDEAISIHDLRYDYSLVDYKSNGYKVKIICKVHGIFEQTPKSHLNGSGCIKCSYRKSNYTKEDVLNKLKSIYGDSYEYPDFEYKSMQDKITLVCKKHGRISKKIISHINYGCKKCYYEVIGDSTRSSNEYFISECEKVHMGRYDYSLVEYVNSKSKVSIICKQHGVFEQIADGHKKGSGCPRCNNSKGENTIQLKILILF